MSSVMSCIGSMEIQRLDVISIAIIRRCATSRVKNIGALWNKFLFLVFIFMNEIGN